MTYFEPGDLNAFYKELEMVQAIDKDELKIPETAHYVDDQIALLPK